MYKARGQSLCATTIRLPIRRDLVTFRNEIPAITIPETSRVRVYSEYGPRMTVVFESIGATIVTLIVYRISKYVRSNVQIRRARLFIHFRHRFSRSPNKTSEYRDELRRFSPALRIVSARNIPETSSRPGFVFSGTYTKYSAQ